MGNVFPTRPERLLSSALLVFTLGGNAFGACSAQSSTAPPPAPSKVHSTAPKHATHKLTASAKPAAATHKNSTSKSASHKATAQGLKSTSRKTSKNSQASRKHGQQVIAPDRARAIQEALIRKHYLDGEPSGTWDSATQAAMVRYQADQGWQVKTIPDSRALIKLGLGPSNDHLLNPESAMTSTPPADPKTAPKQDPPPDTTPHQ